MTEFNNATVIKKANVYFDGKVTSRTVLLPDGSKITLGIMMPGEYEFGTDLKEVMEILSGELKVQLPGSEEWLEIKESGEFTVPAQSKFKLQVEQVADYCCSYIAE